MVFKKVTTILPFLIFYSACTHEAAIVFVDQYHVADIPDYSYLPSYFDFTLAKLNNEYYQDGFQCLIFSSDSDLGKVANSGGMFVIYYDLYICGESDSFYTGPIFPVESKDDRSFYYAAYFPENLPAYKMHHLNTSKEELLAALEERGACLSISAGAMGGGELQTNRITVDFP